MNKSRVEDIITAVLERVFIVNVPSDTITNWNGYVDISKADVEELVKVFSE